MPNKSRAVTLTVTNDVVCPWCYIATLELRKAIARAYTNQLPLLFRIEYKPFEYNAVVSSMSEQAQKGFSERGQEFGVTFARGPSGKVWKSAMANRMLMYAYRTGGQDAQQALLTELFKAHHEKKEDIEDFEVLSKYAEKVGLMSRQETCMFLQSDDLRAELEESVEQCKTMGISNIPLTVVNNKWSITGAQSSDVYYQIFLKLSRGQDL